MPFIIGLLTVGLVLDCLVLILLVLIQLPKKEAGAGLAFGGAATDALFGAGSGNMLTKITKYAAGIFFVLAIGLGLLQGAFNKRTTTDFQRELDKQAKQAASTAPAPVEAPAPAAAPTGSNLLLTPIVAPSATTNAAAP
jgi:preprotein translocase subunit SecG